MASPEKRPYENKARRQPFASQGERPQEKLITLLDTLVRLPASGK